MMKAIYEDIPSPDDVEGMSLIALYEWLEWSNREDPVQHYRNPEFDSPNKVMKWRRVLRHRLERYAENMKYGGVS